MRTTKNPILLIGMISTRPAVCQSNHQEFDSRLGELPAAEPLSAQRRSL
jgi:hypothetical protein